MLTRILAITLMVVLFTACSDDDNGYPITLAYTQRIEIDEFVLYAGSPEGGKEVSKDYGDPIKMWGKRITEYYQPHEIKFVDESSINEINKKNEIKSYYFKWANDSLFAANSDPGWLYYGSGNTQSLRYKMGFYVTMRSIGLSHWASIHQTHGTLNYNDLFNEDNMVTSHTQMLNPTDTMAWCNVSYIYERVK